MLAKTGLTTFTASLARALHRTAICLSKLDRCAEAVTIGQEAVTIRRRLPDGSNDALIALAASTHNLSVNLSRLDRDAEALAATRGTVGIWPRGAGTHPPPAR